MALEDEIPDFSSVVDNPDALAAAASALLAEEEAPALPDPLDGPVTLPAGFKRVKVGGNGTEFEEVRKAWVRELNGEDEERIARAKMRNDINAFVTAVLEAGVERLGDSRPLKDDFNSLVMGDRDFLLLEIARVTYGDDLSFVNFPCPMCNKAFDFSLSLSEDIPVKRLDKVTDASFEIPLRNDRVAVVNLPTVEIADTLAATETDAEANTVLIASSVEEIRGPKGVLRVDGDVTVAKKLSLRDRQALVNAMSERMPGPQYNEVRFNHEPGCGEEVRLTIQLADLFRGL